MLWKRTALATRSNSNIIVSSQLSHNSEHCFRASLAALSGLLTFMVLCPIFSHSLQPAIQHVCENNRMTNRPDSTNDAIEIDSFIWNAEEILLAVITIELIRVESVTIVCFASVKQLSLRKKR